MSKQTIIFIILIFAVVIIWFTFSDDGKITGFVSVEEKYPDMQYLGVFYDAGKGETFASEYDVFVDNVSKGHFSSALEACQTFYPSVKKVWETSVTGDEELFTSRNGKKSERISYANYCYG